MRGLTHYLILGSLSAFLFLFLMAFSLFGNMVLGIFLIGFVMLMVLIMIYLKICEVIDKL